MNALLTVFSGPYALLARLAMVALTALACAGFGAWEMHKWDAGRYEKLQAEYADFRAEAAAAGKVAQKRADDQKAADAARKKEADDENTRTIADLRDSVKRMRDARSGSDFVPAAAPSARDPTIACFDRAGLESALRVLDQDVQGLVDEGSAAAVDLDTAKRWAQSVK